MPLDSTVGGSTTNSYVTISEAASYFANRSHATAWEGVEEQGTLLSTASSVIDWYVSWKGSRVTAEQRMDWPRSGVSTPYGDLYSENEIPEPVKIATYELALSSILADRVADNPLDGIEELKAGSLTIKTDDGLYATKKEVIPDKIWKILGTLTTKGGSAVVRLVRA